MEKISIKIVSAIDADSLTINQPQQDSVALAKSAQYLGRSGDGAVQWSCRTVALRGRRMGGEAGFLRQVWADRLVSKSIYTANSTQGILRKIRNRDYHQSCQVPVLL